MGSQVPPTNFPIRVSPIQRPNPPPDDLHRYWKSHPELGYLERYWPDEHDHDAWISAIRRVLARQFPDFAAADITYFAKGTFNRLYRLTRPDWGSQSYLFRVSIPVDPFFKTESEIATMEYVRRHTTMPIPRVVAFSSSDDNELGYEWILMETMPGEPLRKVWDVMPPLARVAFFTELARHVKQLVALRFSAFGNLYFSDVAEWVNPVMHASTPPSSPTTDQNGAAVDLNLGANHHFVLGRIVAQDFFFDKRVYSPHPRGPFHTTLDLTTTRIALLRHRLTHLSPHPNQPWYSENDRQLALHSAPITALLNTLGSLPPLLSTPHNLPEDKPTLWHDDLSEHNLLLDPVTFELTAVVDWECVGVVPAYETHGALPAFLSDRDWRPTSLVQLAQGVGDNGAWVEAERRKRSGEMGEVRRAYAGVVGRLFELEGEGNNGESGGGDGEEGEEQARQRVELKRGLAKQLEIDSFQLRPWETAKWLRENGFGLVVRRGWLRRGVGWMRRMMMGLRGIRRADQTARSPLLLSSIRTWIFGNTNSLRTDSVVV